MKLIAHVCSRSSNFSEVSLPLMKKNHVNLPRSSSADSYTKRHLDNKPSMKPELNLETASIPLCIFFFVPNYRYIHPVPN